MDILSEMSGAFLVLQLSIGGSKQIIWFASSPLFPCAIPQHEYKVKLCCIFSKVSGFIFGQILKQAMKTLLYSYNM